MTVQNENANKFHEYQAGTLTLGDLTINRLAFGAMRLSTKGFQGPPRDPDDNRTVLRRAVELGVNHSQGLLGIKVFGELCHFSNC